MGREVKRLWRAVPEYRTDVDWSTVQIIDCGEPLVPLTSGRRIWAAPAYHELGYTHASKQILLREGAREALLHAVAELPAGLSLVVWDGLRCLSLQREIAARFAASLPSTLTDAERERRVSQYVAPVPTSAESLKAYPPPHTTGAAVDLTLGDVHGRPLDLGAGFDEFRVNATTGYFEGIGMETGLSHSDRSQKQLRRILHWAMVNAGFAPYAWEFWHFEYSTLRAAAFFGESVADYGPAIQWARNK